VKSIQETLATSPQRKMIVYSQWTSYLDLLESALQGVKISYDRIDGDITSTKERSSILARFCDVTSGVSVLLMSLQVGSIGLNLTAATKAYFCDMWYNPFVEMQAKNRIHRIGQHHMVEVVYLQSSLPVEDGVRSTQIKKEKASKYYVDGDAIDDKVEDKDSGGAGISVQEMIGIFQTIIRYRERLLDNGQQGQIRKRPSFGNMVSQVKRQKGCADATTTGVPLSNPGSTVTFVQHTANL
jgi:SNF2 family DNA or RNA helicase